MTQFTTDRELMRQGAVKVEDATAQIQSLLSSLRSSVDTMMGGWRGDASTAFIQVHDAFDVQANTINQALGDIHTALVSTGATYSGQESSQTATLSGLAGQING
ncbi:MAG: WXG100 family type VII secretion target [Frankiaceae bacterium]|nr:WXG100 family type VII secretion target [Frankiaceae bacterium]